jgi:hypothetical protein
VPQIQTVDPADLLQRAQLASAAAFAAPAAIRIQGPTESLPARILGAAKSLVTFPLRHPVRTAVAAGAALSVGLTSSLAEASSLYQTISQAVGSASQAVGGAASWSGLFWSSVGLLAVVGLRAIYRSNVRPNASSISRLATRFFIPLTGILTLAGALLYSTTWLAPLLGLPASGLWLAISGLAFVVTGIRLGTAVVKGLLNRRTPYMRETLAHKSSLWNRIKTTTLTELAQLGLVHYYAYRHTMTASLLLGVACKIAYNLYTLSINPLAPLIGAGLGLIYAFTVRKNAAREMNPLKHASKPLFDKRSVLWLSLLGAGLGVIGDAGGLWLLANALQAVFFLALEDHALPHSFMLQSDARAVEREIADNIDTDQEIHTLTRSRSAEYRCEIKVSANKENILFSLFTRIFAGVGGKFSLHQINQAGFQPDVLSVLTFLRNTCAGARDMARAAYDRIRPEREANGDLRRDAHGRLCYPVTHQEALEALAGFYQELGEYFINTGSRGDFAETAVNGLVDGTFVAEDANYQLENLGKIIKTRGYLLIREAEKIRAMASDPESPLPPEALYTIALDSLDEAFRHFYPHLIYTPIFVFRNLFPYRPVQKLPSTDAYSLATKGFRSAIGIIRKDHLETRFLELIPMKVAKVLSPDYRSPERWNIESDGPLEDNCFCWQETPVEQITRDQYTDLAYIDNRAHFLRHSTPILDAAGREIGRAPDLNYYPTGDISSVGEMAHEFVLDPPPAGEGGSPNYAEADYYDLVFKNAAVVRLYGDGHKELISGTVTQEAIDSIVWVPGAAPSDDLYNLKSYRESENGASSGNPFIYHFPQGKVTSLRDEEHAGHSVSDLMAILKKDAQRPYLFVQREIPVSVVVPYDRALQDATTDELCDITADKSWFLMRVTTETQKATETTKARPSRQLWVPLNLAKQSVPNWEQIDESRGIEIIPDEREDTTFHMPSVTLQDGTTLELPAGHMLYYLDTLGGYQPKAEIDLGRGKDGPQPVVKFTFLRRKRPGEIIRKVREIDYDNSKVVYREEPIADRDWEVMIQEPLTAEKYAKRSEADRRNRPHIEEREGQTMVILPGGRPPMPYTEYMQQRDLLSEETRYERFMPLADYIKFWLRGSVQ